MLDIISARIKYLRSRDHLTQTELAEKIGVVSNTVAKWEAGLLKPSRDKVNRMAKVFNATADFVLGNVDSEKTIEVSENQELLETLHNVANELDVDLWDMVDAIKESKRSEDPEGFKDVFRDVTEDFINVPVVHLTACAGSGTGYADVQFEVIGTYPIDKGVLLGHSWRNNGYKIMTIEGDSMEPRFADGDRVLLSIDEDVRSGDIAVVCWDYRFYIRGFFLKDDSISLRPLNKNYPDIEIDRQDERFAIIGKVIAVLPPPQMVRGYY